MTRSAPSNSRAVLTIEGQCVRPTAFTYYDLANIHEDYQVDDLSKVDQRLSGKAVRLRKLIDLVGPDFHTEYLTVESEDGAFAASLPLAEISRTAVVIYEQDGKPLERDDGGPVRFVIPYFPDKCANVKSATHMLISEQQGRDTRPSTAAQHASLHGDGDAPASD